MTSEKSTSTPMLRFPKFKDGWTERKAGKYFASSRAKGEVGLPIYSVTQNDGLVRRDSLDRQIGVDAGAEQNLRADKDDLVYNMMRMWQGAVGKAVEPCMVSPAYVVLTPRKIADSQFFLYLFSRKRALYWLWAYSYGLTNDRLRLYYKDFAQIPFTAPDIDEQRHIASFLESVERRIAELEKKRNLLLQYKKGVMQQIFSQQIRFKDDNGKAFPAWVEKQIRQLAKVNPPHAGLPDEFEYIDLESVTEGILSRTKSISRENAPSRAQRLLQPHDVLFQIVRPYQRNNLFFELTGSFVASTGYAQLRSKIDPQFLFQLVHSESLVREVVKRCTGTSYPAINSNDFATVQVWVPSSKKEQVKIGDLLKRLDQKVISVKCQLDCLRQLKQGLLQQMFV